MYNLSILSEKNHNITQIKINLTGIHKNPGIQS